LIYTNSLPEINEGTGSTKILSTVFTLCTLNFVGTSVSNVSPFSKVSLDNLNSDLNCNLSIPKSYEGLKLTSFCAYVSRTSSVEPLIFLTKKITVEPSTFILATNFASDAESKVVFVVTISPKYSSLSTVLFPNESYFPT